MLEMTKRDTYYLGVDYSEVVDRCRCGAFDFDASLLNLII